MLPDGSYVFAPRWLAEPGSAAAPGDAGTRFEACLQLQGSEGTSGASGAPQDAHADPRGTRVRVVLLGGPRNGRAWDLRRVEVRGCLLRLFLSCKHTR